MTPAALDIAIGIIIALSALTAYFRGFVREAFMIGGLMLASYCAYRFGHLLLPEFSSWLHVEDGEEGRMIWGILSPSMAAKVFSFGSVFLMVFFTVALLGYYVAQGVRSAGLGIIDHLLGAGFGLARGFLFVFMIYVPIAYLVGKDQFPAWAEESKSVSVLDGTLTWAEEKFDLDKFVEKGEDGVAVKFDKIKAGEFGALSKEEREKIEKSEKSEKGEEKIHEGTKHD